MRTSLTTAVVFASVAAAHAASGTATFAGLVVPTCTIVVGSPGVMTISPSMQVLSTRNPGGVPALATVISTGGMGLSVDAPLTGLQPIRDTTPTTWTASYSATGVQAIVETESPTLNLTAGTSLVSVNLRGQKSGTDVFAQGAYQSTVLLRCE